VVMREGAEAGMERERRSCGAARSRAECRPERPARSRRIGAESREKKL
jgi:hypothetical protein